MVDRVLRRDDVMEPFVAQPAVVGSARVLGSGAVVRFGTVASPVPRGTTLLEAANAAGVDLRSYCGGNCSCGTCRIQVVQGARNLSRVLGLEEMVLGMDAAGQGDRLACQAQVLGDVEVRVPEWF
jgi:ferredoxin